MLQLMKKLAITLILWFPFSLGCIAAILVTLWAIWAEENVYGKNVLRSMDKNLAAVLGFDGYYTLSAECGVTTDTPWIYLRWLLDKIQPGHCAGVAKQEGLTENTGIWGRNATK